jgi:hypothetical protein
LNAIWTYHATHFLSSTSGCCVFYIISPKELPLAHHILLERVSKIKYHVPQHNSTALHLPHREVHAHHRIQDSNSTILYSPSYIHHLMFTILCSPSSPSYSTVNKVTLRVRAIFGLVQKCATLTRVCLFYYCSLLPRTLRFTLSLKAFFICACACAYALLWISDCGVERIARPRCCCCVIV